MSEQLDRAYELIKQGNTQSAITMIEPLIRAEPNNEDAWWLLANATEESEAKRNSLNNVIRLTSNQSRQQKAEMMLKQLDADHYDFEVSQSDRFHMSAYDDNAKASIEKRSGFGCGKIALVIVALVGVCAIVSCFGIYFVAGNLFDVFNYPDNYDDMGIVQTEQTFTGTLSETEPTDGFRISADEGDSLVIELESTADTAPFVLLYDRETRLLVGFGQPQALSGTLFTTIAVPESGDYLIIIRGFEILGENIGYGDYSITIDIQ